MKRIVVTGSEGGVGRLIVAALRERWPTSTIVRVGRNIAPSGTGDLWRVDLRDASMARIVLNRADAVIHAAAHRYDPEGKRGLDVAVHDVQVTANIVDAAAKQQVPHLVFLSSSTVYERAPRDGEMSEHEAINAGMPASPVGMGKFAGEAMVREWAKQTGGTYTTWRMFNAITPDEPHDRPAHIQCDLFRKLFVDGVEDIRLQRTKRTFLWASEAARAISNHLDDSRARGAFNLGGTNPLTMAEIVAEMVGAGEMIGMKPPLRTVSIETQETRSMLPSLHDVQTKLGWRPTMNTRQAIAAFTTAKIRSLL